MKYTTHLRRHTLKINAQRIIDTPPLYFQLSPCIYTVYFKRLTESLFRSGTDAAGSKQERDLGYAQISSLSSVHGSTLLNRLFAKALAMQNREEVQLRPNSFFILREYLENHLMHLLDYLDKKTNIRYAFRHKFYSIRRALL